MASNSRWGITPHESVDLEVARRGRDAVVDGCTALLGGSWPGDVSALDVDLVVALAGPLAHWALDREHPRRHYWLRVWGGRGLLYAWDDRAGRAVVAGLADEHWRVREMAAKVCAAHRIEDAVPALDALSDDSAPRVRQAARRALDRIAAGSASGG